MKEHEIDRLKELFENIESISPSEDFERRIMERIHLESKLKERRMNRLNTVLPAVIIVCIIGLQIGVFYIFDLSFSAAMQPLWNSLAKIAENTEPNINVLMIGVVSLLLLLIDLFVRKRIRERQAEKQ